MLPSKQRENGIIDEIMYAAPRILVGEHPHRFPSYTQGLPLAHTLRVLSGVGNSDTVARPTRVPSLFPSVSPHTGEEKEINIAGAENVVPAPLSGQDSG